ncbi:hypothetical protein [Mangrovibacter yixingensis]|uniref:hypothetical protein n=1 Tax=Mangrovibacter yixingensis TaxID=1529639 RepID=UPI001CFD93D3|nr:hypothetical protein [Mangrovibacter yixingensis]
MPDIMLTHRIMRIHLSSWRYFAALTLPPLVVGFLHSASWGSLVSLVLFITTHYYCWRLWLDERLFQLIERDENLVSFDAGMACIWGKRTGVTRNIAQRWQGATRLFYRAIVSLVLLWLVVLVNMIYWLSTSQ